jgi:PAS domain S-box-containing protein
MNINGHESVTELAQPSLTRFEVGYLVGEDSSEEFLRSIFDSVQASIFVVDVMEDGDFRYVALNPAHEQWTGILSEDIKGKKPEDILCPSDARKVRKRYDDCLRFGKKISYEQCLQFQGIPTWWKTNLTPLINSKSRIYRLVGISTNINLQKQTEEALRKQGEREQLLLMIAQSIRQGLDLDIVLNQTVTNTRNFLECDRVLVYRFGADWDGEIIAECSAAPWIKVLGSQVKDSCFSEKQVEAYKRGRIQFVEDIYAGGLHPCYIDLLAKFEVRANIVVPILANLGLWGLLIVHHCQGPRQWHTWESDLLKQLATQVGIAVQQTLQISSLQSQINELESRFQTQSVQLGQALNREKIAINITEQLRNGNDEHLALESAVTQMAMILHLTDCHIELYNTNHTQATIVCQYATTTPSQDITREVVDYPKIYQPLLRKKHLQFAELASGWNPKLNIVMQLAYPIYDAQGILGNLWLTRTTQSVFDEWELLLVQQVAAQCAIAIRQARLYKANQEQAKELQRLERLKKEFLRNLSHELRTPITSISLAVQTLESILKQEGVLDIEIVPQLLQILEKECVRESKLIDDLITLTYLEADIRLTTSFVVDLQTWLPSIIEPFREYISCQKQYLNLSIAKNLPGLETDITDLERIITELLSNACKYTPASGLIKVAAFRTGGSTILSISNTGIELSQEEISRIFEPFYRVPNNDPWKFGGTGLGLALVQKLVTHLGAQINVESGSGVTTFSLTFASV